MATRILVALILLATPAWSSGPVEPEFYLACPMKPGAMWSVGTVQPHGDDTFSASCLQDVVAPAPQYANATGPLLACQVYCSAMTNPMTGMLERTIGTCEAYLFPNGYRATTSGCVPASLWPSE